MDNEFISPTDMKLDSLSMPEHYNIQGLPLEIKRKVVERYNEFFESSIKLRKFDEKAKKDKLNIKSINQYKNLLVSKLI